MSHSDSELDGKLRELLRVMVARLPADKKLSAAVVQQLLRAKYANIYPESYIVAREAFISDTVSALVAERSAAAAKKPAPADDGSSAADSGSDDDDEEESDDESEEESDDEEGSGDDEDEDDDDDDEEEESGSEGDEGFDSSSEDSASSVADDEPERKKTKSEGPRGDGEEVALLAKCAGAEETAERCKGMVACLKKLSYRVRPPSESETLEEYLNGYLVTEFVKHGMDPARYSKTDIKQYKVRREVELLQQDGASLHLDKRNRLGRGYAGVSLPGAHGNGESSAPGSTAYKTSAFLDDE